MKITAFTVLLFFLFINAGAQPTKPSDPNIEKKTFVYKTVGKTKIHADLYRPRGDSKLKPVIIWIHGGALMNGSRNGLSEDHKKFYLDAGYAIVSIDYRLAPETKLSAIIEDLKDAFAWVHTNGAALLKVDNRKVFVVGHSAGGYLALMSGYVAKNPPQGIVSFYGYGDIIGDWYAKPDSFYLTRDHVLEETTKKLISDTAITSSPLKDRGLVYLYSRQTGKWPLMVGGHDPFKEAEWFRQYCPLKNVGPKYPPVLLIHGTMDSDVPFEQSVLMDRELTAKKIKHKFIQMKGYEHGFERAQGAWATPEVQKVFTDIVVFLKDNQ